MVLRNMGRFFPPLLNGKDLANILVRCFWWGPNDNGFQRLDSGDVPREFKEKTLLGLHGLGCVTYPEFIRNRNMTGFKTGLYKVEHLLSGFEIRDTNSSQVGNSLINAMKNGGNNMNMIF